MAKTNVYTAQVFSAEELRALTGPDPQPMYEELARSCPFHRGPDGTIMLTRMADIVAVNKRPDVLGPGAHGPTLGGARPLPPLDLDGPEHAKFRRLLDPVFSPANAAALAPQVRKLADQLIDGFIDDRRADLKARFCDLLPSLFFLRLLGLPESDLDFFVPIKDTILGRMPAHFTLPERLAAITDASARCYAYLARELDARSTRAEPGDDLIGWLMTAEARSSEGAPEKLTREQILDISFLLVLAGLDTTAAAMACILARLARVPELRRRLVDEPALWPAAVEELLRIETPVQHGYRTPVADVVVAGETIPAGTTFFLSWAAASLDPAVFADPSRIDFGRQPNPHVAFGFGIHRCLGIHLARMELATALEQLHRRIPDYRLAPGHELVFSGKPRTVNGLPLIW